MLVYSTAGDREEAKRIARRLIEEGLAACVNLWPIESVYEWEGEVEEDEEVALLVKTTAERAERVVRRIVELHSYDVPAVLVIPVLGGHGEFLEWVREQVS
ncbi:MAG: divalent-cation tolerance protein CutA [Euryarchaeota archaeon]